MGATELVLAAEGEDPTGNGAFTANVAPLLAAANSMKASATCARSTRQPSFSSGKASVT
jgi:hypothetical protein